MPVPLFLWTYAERLFKVFAVSLPLCIELTCAVKEQKISWYGTTVIGALSMYVRLLQRLRLQLHQSTDALHDDSYACRPEEARIPHHPSLLSGAQYVNDVFPCAILTLSVSRSWLGLGIRWRGDGGVEAHLLRGGMARRRPQPCTLRCSVCVNVSPHSLTFGSLLYCPMLTGVAHVDNDYRV